MVGWRFWSYIQRNHLLRLGKSLAIYGQSMAYLVGLRWIGWNNTWFGGIQTGTATNIGPTITRSVQVMDSTIMIGMLTQEMYITVLAWEENPMVIEQKTSPL